ncbi:MAG: DegT/DnrJ/EryC1/StrS family aminotransferase [Bacteroidetes bacterium]|nr:DegT/DnrJ/EryC1/StrS family aminotransferase [Bacteroidota bacterium]
MNYIPHSQPWITEAEESAVQAVMQSALLSKAEGITAFEKKMAEHLNKKFALFTGNGSQAQALILMAMELAMDDEVILPSYVCKKVYDAVIFAGATPVLCDIGTDWLMTPEEVAQKISGKTRAIILPHVVGLNGWNADFNSFGIPVLEDICQSFSDQDGPGTYTNFAFTSFHGTKPIAAGEGGMLFVNDENIYSKILKIRKEIPVFTVGNELTSAVANTLLERWNVILQRRKEIAELYHFHLPQRLNMKFLKQKNATNFRYLLQSDKDFQSIRLAYLDKGIHVRQGIDNLIHRDIGLSDTEFPNSSFLFQTTVSIPILPQLKEEEIQHIISVTKEFAEKEII